MELSAQAKTFLVILATGALLGFTFDFYRVLRGIFKPRWFVTGIADLIYWLAATIIVVAALLVVNWGELRLYVFIGLAVGALLYYRMLSRHSVHVLIAFIRLLAVIVRYVRLVLFYCLLKPFVFTGKIVWQPIGLVTRRIADWSKKPPDENIPPPS